MLWVMLTFQLHTYKEAVGEISSMQEQVADDTLRAMPAHLLRRAAGGSASFQLHFCLPLRLDSRAPPAAVAALRAVRENSVGFRIFFLELRHRLPPRGFYNVVLIFA